MLREYLELPPAVRILCFGSLINRAGSFVLIFLTIYASEEMGFGVRFAAACMGGFGFGSMCGSMLGGQLSDQLGRRTVMLIALFGGAALLLLLGSATNRYQFMMAVIVFAIVVEMYRPAASAMIADMVDLDRRPHAFALMYIAINLGFAIAPPIGGFLAEHSFRWLFWGDALTMCVYGCIILVSVPESLVDSDTGALDEASDVGMIPWRDAAMRIFRDTTFLWFCVATLLIELVFMQGMSTLPIYIRQTGSDHLQFGLLMSINGFLIFLIQLPMTHWLQRFNSMTVVIVGALLITIGFGLCSLGNGFRFLAFTIAIWTLGEILQAPFKQAIATEMAPKNLRGRYLGAFTMCYALALTIGAPVGGQILSRYGPAMLWTMTFFVGVVALAVYLKIHSRITKRVYSG